MAYPPGSTYKMIPTISALENKVISSGTEIEDKGLYTKYAGLYLKCMIWSPGGGATHKSINVMEALMFSCNYFYYTIGDNMDIEMMDEVAKQFGLGEPTGVELEENVGQRANPETKKAIHTGDEATWWGGDNLTAAIGQGDNRFTPLQMAVYTATLANKGVRYKATFMNRVVSADYRELLAENTPKVLSKMEMDPATINAYFEGMKLVVNNPNGTAWSPYWSAIPATVAGKTGTAEHVPGKSDHGAFVCFAPADDPQIAIAVYVECGGHGVTLASIARSILSEYFKVGTVSDVVTYENKIS
jgi:penicillin-binding protein 2